MKEKIHPKYVKAKVTCSCGETFFTRSTTPEIRIEICSKCHPFFTGKQKYVDSGGRVERFQKKFGSVIAEKQEEKTEKEKEVEKAQKDEKHKPEKESKEASNDIATAPASDNEESKEEKPKEKAEPDSDTPNPMPTGRQAKQETEQIKEDHL